MVSSNSSSTPAILPISSPQSTTTTTTETLQSSSAVRSFLTNIQSTIQTGLSTRRPWPELLDRAALSKPDSISDATVRIRKNYTYFRTNYLTIITAVIAISLLTNPFSLITLSCLLAAWLFMYVFRQSSDAPLSVFGREVSERETLLFLIVASVVVFFLTSVGSVLASALMVGVAIVCVHGAFRVPEDLFLDEQETSALNGGGIISYFVGTQQPAVVGGARV